MAGLALGVAAGSLAWTLHEFRPASDFGQFWSAARALLAGADPYGAVGPGATYEWPWPLVYPFTSVLGALPFAPFAHRSALALFVGISCALLGYAIARDGYRRLPLFVSAGFIWAAVIGQWSLALTAAAMLPALGFLFAVKPTLGLALFVYRPSWAAAIGAAALVLLSFMVEPSWLATWLAIARAHAPRMQLPILMPGGVLLLLAALRWKRPESRMLLALALTPQTLFPYETLVLFLVAESFGGALLLAALSWVALHLWRALIPVSAAFYEELDLYARMIVPLMYLPALVMVLRRPNEGDTPALVATVRRWLGVAFRPLRPDTGP